MSEEKMGSAGNTNEVGRRRQKEDDVTVNKLFQRFTVGSSRGTNVTRRIPEEDKISFTDRMHLTEEKEEEGEDPEREERGQQRKQNILQNAIGERG